MQENCGGNPTGSWSFSDRQANARKSKDGSEAEAKTREDDAIVAELCNDIDVIIFKCVPKIKQLPAH